MKPFLEVITRCYERPKLLERNKASLAALTSDDWQQTYLVDEVGRGVVWANANLHTYAPHLVGRYIWVLDDDDECIYPALVDDLQAIVNEHNPDVIIVRGQFSDGNVKPEQEHWRRAPICGHIGIPNFIVRREIWQQYASAFSERMVYEADYDFIATLFDNLPSERIYWHGEVVFNVVRRSLGVAGDEL